MKKILLTCSLSLICMFASSQLLVENFNYSDGNLVGNGGWTAHSGAGNNPVQVSSNKAVVAHFNSSAEDINTTFTSQSSGCVYYKIVFSVDDLGAPYSGTDNEYFIHFNSGTFVARVDIGPPPVALGYSVGIATEGGTAEAVWPVDLLFGVDYTLVVKYDIDNNSTKLWVDPVDENSTSIDGNDLAGTGDAVSEIAFRQSNSSEDETIRVSELIVDVQFPGTPAPVQLNYFSAKSMDAKSALLDWSTASEEDNEYFSIEHSIDGREFIEIDRVDGAINSNEMKYYSYIHENAPKGMNYYRLRQVDTDGAFSYSPIEVVNLRSDISFEINPTIAESEIQIYINENLDNEMSIEVYNILGRLVISQIVGRDLTQTSLNINDLHQGHYFIKLHNGLESYTMRFIKK